MRVAASVTHEELRARVGEMYKSFVNPGRFRLASLMSLDKIEAEARGCIIRTADGDEYLDCLGSFGVFNVGHNHPKVIEAVERQLRKMPLSTRFLLSEPLAELGARLAAITPEGITYMFPVHSGACAVEGALKLARAATGRQEIVATHGAFHGKSFGALSASGKDYFKDPFRPLVPEFKHVPYGDSDAAARAVSERTAAFIVEPIQGEAGVIIPPDGYLRDLRETCDRNGALLIVDEVQTGLGRTGAWFGCDHDGVAPDIMTMAKALGGGVMPLAAFVGNERAFGPLIEDPYLHSTTIESHCAFAAACATIDVIREEGLVERSRDMGAYLLQQIREVARSYPDVVTDVRGRGLMVAMDFVEKGHGGIVLAAMLDQKILVGFSFNNPQTIRLEPPLVISKAEVDRAVSGLAYAFEQARQVMSYS